MLLADIVGLIRRCVGETKTPQRAPKKATLFDKRGSRVSGAVGLVCSGTHLGREAASSPGGEAGSFGPLRYGRIYRTEQGPGK